MPQDAPKARELADHDRPILLPETSLPPGKPEVVRTEAEEIARLSAPSWEERVSALVGLGRIGGVDAVVPVTAALDDSDPFVRAAAARTLGSLHANATADRLKSALKDEQWPVRLSAAAALGIFEEASAVPPLIELLRDECSQVRIAATVALVEIGPPAVEPLTHILGSDDILSRRRGEPDTITDPVLGQFSHSNLRQLVMEALMGIGEPSVQSLVNRLRDGNADVARDAASVLRQLRWKPPDAEAEARYCIALGLQWDRVARLGEVAVIPALQHLQRGCSSSEVPYAVEAIVALGAGDRLLRMMEAGEVSCPVWIAETLVATGDERVMDVLATALGDAGERDRYRLAPCLARIGGPRAAKVLIAALGDRDPKVQQWAARALGELGDSQAVDPLLELMNSRMPDVRVRAAEALGKLGDRRAVESLMAACNDSYLDLRVAAIDALGQMGDERVVEPLIDIVNDSDSHERLTTEAVRALGRLGRPQAIDPIAPLLNHQHKPLQCAAALSLARLQDERGLQALEVMLRNPDLYGQMGAAALGELGGERATRILAAALDDRQLRDRDPIAEALMKAGPAGTQIVIAGLRNEDPVVRTRAVRMLGAHGDARVVSALADALHDQDADVRAKAAMALADLGNAEAIGPLTEALRREGYPIRVVVARSLKHLGWQPATPGEQAVCLAALGEWQILIDMGPAGRPALMAALAEADIPWPDLSLPLELRTSIVDECLNLLQNKGVCRPALGELGDHRAAAPLVEALRADDPDVRCAAAVALGELGELAAAEPLIDALADKDRDVRRAAAKALGKLAAKQSVGPLVAALDDSYWGVREAALQALGTLAEPAVVGALARKLPELRPHERGMAFRTIFRLKSGDVGRILVDFLPDWQAGPEAALVLERLGWIPATEAERIHYLVARRDRAALLDRWAFTKTVLKEDIIGDSVPALHNALYALMGCGKDEVLAELVELLDQRGSKDMAEAFLNCGNARLNRAARVWARRRGYTINSGPGSAPVGWGKM